MIRRLLAPFALAFSLGLSLAAVAPANADPLPAGVMAPVDTLVAGINAGDTAKIASAYSVQPTIVDEFSPFQWQGTDAAKKWAKDFRALQATYAITKLQLSRRPATYFRRDGHFGYLCVPMNLSYLAKGQAVTERGAFVLSLYSLEGIGWKIRASTWYLINDSIDPPLGAGLR